jgi:hypothetical protein
MTDPKMTLHMTNTQILPYMVWNDSNLDLEWRYQVVPRQKAFSPDLLRAESLGLQTGNIPQSLAHNRDDLSHFGTLMVHEIRSWFTNKRARDMLEKMLRLGYGQDARVINYWDPEPPLSVSDEQCKWLLLENDGRLMVLLCTWNEEAAPVSVQIDVEALGVDLKRALDAENSEPVEFQDATFRFEMAGYGTRLFRLE